MCFLIVMPRPQCYKCVCMVTHAHVGHNDVDRNLGGGGPLLMLFSTDNVFFFLFGDAK